jgi:hypothetical protein
MHFVVLPKKPSCLRDARLFFSCGSDIVKRKAVLRLRKFHRRNETVRGLRTVGAEREVQSSFPFGNFIVGNATLAGAFKSTIVVQRFRAKHNVFRCSALHAGTPHAEGSSLHFFAHKRYDFCFANAELCGNSVEWRAVFPRHFNDSINVCFR